MQDRTGLLRKTYLFGRLSGQDLRRVAALLKERSERAQSTIYRQGDPDHNLYLVVSGRLRVRNRDERGKERVVNRLRAGDCFGTHSLLTGEPRDVTVDAEDPVVLLYLEKRDFDALLEHHPHLREALSLQILERLRRVPLFSQLSDDDLQRVALATGQTCYRRDSTIYRQGELSTTFYVIESGRAALLSREESGEDRTITHLREGDFFGERSLLTQQPRDTSVQVLEDSRLLYLNRKDFDRLLLEVPSIKENLTLEAEARRVMVTQRFPWQREGEALIALSRKHVYSFVRSLWVLAIPLLCLGAVIVVVGRFGWPGVWIYLGAALAGASAVALTFWLWVDWRNDYYAITNKRVVHREKTVLLRESRDEAPLESVQDISILMPSIMGRLVGFDDLSIQTAGAKGRVVFKTVGNAAWIRDRLFEQLERLKSEEKVEQRDAIRQRLQVEMGHVEERQEAPADREGYMGHVASEPAAMGQRTSPPAAGLLRNLRGYLIPQMRTEDNGVVTWRKHWFRLLEKLAGAAILLFIFLQLGVAALLGLITPPVRFQGLFWAVLVPGIALALFLAWFRYEDWRNDIYQLTDERIIDVERLPLGLREERREASLAMIQDIGYEIPGLIANLLDYGNVVIETAGREAVFTFSWVHRPRRVQEEVFARMDAFRQREKQQQRERRADELLDWFATYTELSEEQTGPPNEEKK
jgi:CRP-like cAMP-binding protein/energy-coupling factor transporter transmembrane protein EcfT